MAEIALPYGRGQVSVNIDEGRLLEVVSPNRVAKRPAGDVLAGALAHPCNAPAFDEFMGGAGSLLVIVNDATRPTPTAAVLDCIAGRIDPLRTKFIIATGAHRGPSEEEFRQIFADHYDRYKDIIHVHDARRSQDMVHIGTSRSGTKMSVNRLGVEADRILAIGSVEPHYFAGFTGGRKAFLPGIASFETIEQNHSHALEDCSQVLALDGNAVHEDMIDALKSIADKQVFSIMTVLDGDDDIYAATAGHIHDAFYAAVEKSREVFVVKIRSRADVVVAVAPFPMDIDLYQSQKAIENGKHAIRDGGVVILLSQCRTGVGDETFLDLLRSAETPEAVFEKISAGYKLGYHKAARMVEMMRRCDIWAVTDIPDDVIESIFMRPMPDIQTAIDKALEATGPGAKVTLLTNASITVPVA